MCLISLKFKRKFHIRIISGNYFLSSICEILVKQFLVTLSECDSSDQAVSVVVVVVGVNFFSFSTSSLKPLHGFASNFVWLFLGWTPTEFVKIGVLPLFFMELWVILCNFWPILKKSSIKPLTRNHSYLVWRVPRGSSF